MSRETRTTAFLFLLTLVLGFAYVLMLPPPSDGLAKVHMLNVGQGDSFLIEAANGHQILIDGGKDDAVLTALSEVMPRGDHSIDVVIATHPDADHIGGLPLVLSRYDVGLFVTSGVLTDTQAFQSLYQQIEKKKIPAYYVRHGMNFTLDSSLPTEFSILFPDRDTSSWETNAASVVGRLEIGKRSMLLTGDSPASVEGFLATALPTDIDVDILKLGHHGSKTSSSDVFLRATSPGLALISAGVGNRYGHPAPEVTERLRIFGISSISTQDVGTYTLTTNGEKWFKK